MTERISRVLLVLDGPSTDAHVAAVAMLRYVEVAVSIEIENFGPCIGVAFDNPIRQDDFGEGLHNSLKAFRFVKRVVTFENTASDLVAVGVTAARIRGEAMSRIGDMRPALPEGSIPADEAMRHVGDLAVWDRFAKRISRIILDEWPL